MSRFVQRDGLGRVTGSFANPQSGVPIEVLADDDPALVAFHANGIALTAAEIDAVKEDRLDALQTGAIRAVAQALFMVNNDVRVLKGQQPINAAQFRTFLKSLL